MVYRKVMLTLDGSEFDARAVEQVRDIAGAESEVMLVYVTPKYHGWMPSPFSEDVMRLAEQREAQQRLQRARDYLLASGLCFVEIAAVQSDSPGSAIVDAAHRFGCDIVVMGTRDHSGFWQLIRGSVAGYVTRHLTEFDVLLVHTARVAA